MMTKQTFEEKIAALLPGEAIVYHEGLLMADRQCGPNFLTVAGLAYAAFTAMEAGVITLTQRRVRHGFYEYLATKRPPPHKKVVWWGCYSPDPMKYGKRKAANENTARSLAAVGH